MYSSIFAFRLFNGFFLSSYVLLLQRGSLESLDRTHTCVSKLFSSSNFLTVPVLIDATGQPVGPGLRVPHGPRVSHPWLQHWACQVRPPGVCFPVERVACVRGYGGVAFAGSAADGRLDPAVQKKLGQAWKEKK